jgi:DNA-directed RNA polymerase subunit E'/Rpb7
MNIVDIIEVNSLETAIDTGKVALSQLKPNEPIHYNHEFNCIPIKYPHELYDPLWQIDEESLLNTMKYLFEQIHHQCYLVCINNNKITMYRLTSTDIGEIYSEAIQKGKDNIHNNKFISVDKHNIIKNFQPVRVMQCIIKNRISETQTNNEYLDVLRRLKLPNGLFIFNLTDAVIVRKDGYHPFPMVVGKLKLEPIKKMLPIFTMSGQRGYIDIPIPNYDELKLVYSAGSDDKYNGFVTNWEDKKINKAVFRGGPTGCGYTEDTNMRIKLYRISEKIPDLFDVKLSGSGKTIDSTSIRFDPKYGLGMLNTKIPSASKADYLKMYEQSNYKYLIHIDGNVNAYRLIYTLTTGSLMLRVMSEYTSWAESYLIPNVHYIPIKSDLSDLQEKLIWCRSNDQKCKQIAYAGMTLARTILTPEFIDNYFYMLFSKFTIKDNLQKTSDFKDYGDYKNRRKSLTIYKLPDDDICYHPIKVAIIIPHRNRLDNLNEFIDKFKKFNLRNNVMDVYVIDQNNNQKFNRGLLLNIGFYISKYKNYDRYIFHDVDTYPDEKMFEHYFKYANFNIHYTSPELSGIKYKYDKFLGGVEAFTEYDFERINGFPNTFFGWGGEDDALYNRAVANQLIFYRPTQSHGSYNLVPHPDPTKEELNSKKAKNILIDLSSYESNGVNQLNNLNISVSSYDINNFIKNYNTIKPNPVDNPILLRNIFSRQLPYSNIGEIGYYSFKVDFKSNQDDIIEELSDTNIVLMNESNMDNLTSIINNTKITINNQIYNKSFIHDSIIVPFKNMGKNIESYFVKYARDHIEGKCRNEGYIRRNSCKVITHTSGLLNATSVVYNVIFLCEVFVPYHNMTVECYIKNKTKIGFVAILSDTENPATIYISKEHHKFDLDELPVEDSDKLIVSIVGYHYEKNDETISAFGLLNEINIPLRGNAPARDY